MLRASSTFAVRTLTRALRAARRPIAARKAQLRLDTLEAREQPGSVLSGTAAGRMIDPLAAMTLAVGDAAFATAIAAPSAASPTPTETSAAGSAPSASPATFSPAHESPADSRAASEGSGTAPVGSTNLDAPDLSLADAAQFVPPSAAPA
ncbi:MAG: hypothetical protein J2P46_15065, partial [Zavarzinella sp.]|nr:hypothetical protein [Zavarzinella sp.]